MEQQQLRDSGIEQGKIFVGGLSWDTTDESFEKYFAQFGEVESVKIMKDPSTHKPRGFGFVTFKNPATVEEVFKIASHTLDNKKVDPKHATCKPPQPTQQQQQTFDKRIFIGGLPVDAKPGDVKAVFDDLHLKVSSVDIKFVGKADDNPTDNPKNRGFGFVDFEKEEHVTTACTEKYITINGKKVEIKKAIPRRTQKQDINPQYAANEISGYYVGRGGSYGSQATAGYAPSYYGYPHHQYTGYTQSYTQHSQYPQYDWRAYPHPGQQPMATAYSQDTVSSYTAQPRGNYTAGDQYGTGVSGFGGYEHPPTATYNYQPDQASIGAVSYGRANTQQRSGFSYGGRS